MAKFPFTKLSGELQLLILGECDPITAGKLLKVNPPLKGLYARYPEQAFCTILSNVPEPVAALARLSLDLFTLADENFDPIPIMGFLHRHSLFDWHLLQPSPHNLVGDPLGVLSTMIDLFEEVDEAARAIGECWAAGIETFLDPYAQPDPAALSDTEHVRIASGLWMIQIYYQMRIQIAPYSAEMSCSFPEAFFRKLKPWQVEQGRCIDHFVRAYCCDWSSSIHCLANLGPSSLQRLADSNYFRRFYSLFDDKTPANKFIPHFSRAASSVQSDRNDDNSAWHTSKDSTRDLRISAVAEQLKNHVWRLHEAQVKKSPAYTDPNYERHMFWNLGLLFWEQERTVSTDESGSNKHSSSSTLYSRFLHKVGPNPNRHVYLGNLLPARLADIEYAKSQQITKWTRCTEQCTVEEWLCWKSAVLRDEEGKEPLPDKYITLGAVCSRCGDDGHWSSRCDPTSWSEDPDEE
ncbi:hypothetical protein E8E11_011440 [Didymella keratinophila]|nr:hypothetical protein E8E11_011440 [Didymella keratinophila]